MMNINQLTEQLRMLPDQALQRVAMMYKQDPYIFPMVISESMARKKMRMAAQGQGPQGPQPKVVDQALMSMAEPPPNAGLPGLPAPNMQNMADGGIAGYADEADMDFAQRSEPVVKMAEGGVARYAGATESLVRLPNAAETMYSSQMGPSSDPLAEERRQQYVDQLALQEAERVLQGYGQRQRAADPEGFQRAVAARDAAARRVAGARRLPDVNEGERRFKDPKAITAEELALYKDLYPKEPPKAPMMPIPEVGAAPGAAAKPPAAAPGAAPGAGAAPARPAAPSEGGIYALTGRMFDPVAQELKGARGRMLMDAERRSDEEQMAYEAGKPKGKIAEELEKTLRKEEEGAGGERKQALNMAIFNAGLAMMAGTSPRALENIAKGAMAGSAQYADAIKDLKKAGKERQKMLADIEQARRAEARDDHKTAMEHLRRRNEREERADMFYLEAGTKLGFSRADAATKLYTEKMQQEGAMARTRMQDPLALARALGRGDPEIVAGYKAMQDMKGEPSLIRQLALEAVKNPASLTVLEKQNPGLYAQVMAEINKLGGGAAGAGIDLSQWGSPQQVGGR